MTFKNSKEPAALICGSVAYDTILVFPDRFKTHILPDKLHTLNVSFLVPEMRREFGGCAANIAYGLHLLGDKGLAMATAGHDFGPYRDRMLSQGLSVEFIRPVVTPLRRRPLSPLTWITIRSPPFIPVRCSSRT